MNEIELTESSTTKKFVKEAVIVIAITLATEAALELVENRFAKIRAKRKAKKAAK